MFIAASTRGERWRCSAGFWLIGQAAVMRVVTRRLKSTTHPTPALVR